MADDVRNNGPAAGQGLERLQLGQHISPVELKKEINQGEDVAVFLQSKAFVYIVSFLGQLNRAMFPVQQPGHTAIAWPTQSVHITLSPQVMRLKVVIQTLGTVLKETPPATGPRRFGNAAFRTWFAKIQERVPGLLQQALADNVWGHVTPDNREALRSELGEYLLGSFGSPERLDYGTGHELSFLAFLGAIWRLNGFAPSKNNEEERAIVVGILEPYFSLVRNLIRTYSLEPAGSHGVWGLDDHAFLPYILGSAQLATPITPGSRLPTEGSLAHAPSPALVTKEQHVRTLTGACLYFAAIAFIYDVKSGPFWEHSPTLYDISGITAGWSKINKGLMKMYMAEVLSKFPVVQHLHFGSIFPWEQDPRMAPPVMTAHSKSHPPPRVAAHHAPLSTAFPVRQLPPMAPPGAGTGAPWANRPQRSTSNGSTRRPHIFGDVQTQVPSADQTSSA